MENAAGSSMPIIPMPPSNIPSVNVMPDIPMPPSNAPVSKEDNEDGKGGGGGGGVPDFDELAARFAALQGK